jgi:S-adenosyl-L-methionine hydrolase (adenosine-forming)
VGTPFKFITFSSDYGIDDEFVGVCRGVIKRIAPDVQILDITHGIEPQDVQMGALILSQALPFMPPAVHLAIVDPGVGTTRRGVAIATGDGSVMVGPDNGLLWLAAEELGGAIAAHEITNDALMLTQISRTFHGRDVFAPVAAHLSLGTSIDEVGPELALDDLARVTLPQPRVDDDHVHGQVVMTDHFGNLGLNIHRADLEGAGILLGDMLELRIGGKSWETRYCETFSEVGAGRVAVLEDSHRHIAVAVNRGSARHMLEARRGDPVILARVHQGKSGTESKPVPETKVTTG